MFRFYIILGANPCDTWENPKNELFMKHPKQFFFLIKKKKSKAIELQCVLLLITQSRNYPIRYMSYLFHKKA